MNPLNSVGGAITTGVILALILSGTTLNVMSLMGVVMLAGVAIVPAGYYIAYERHNNQRLAG